MGGDFFENVPSYAQREAHIREVRKQMQTVAYDKLKAAITNALYKAQ